MTDRGHVPFALLGVLLLVTSVAVSTSMHAPTTDSEVTVDSEVERLTAETQTALRESSLTAARNAAAEPVTQRADTPTGQVLRANHTFEDALRLRIYVQLRESLDRLSVTRNGLTVDARLPEATMPDGARAARDRVTVRPAGENETKLAVTVEGIELSASRNGRTVATKALSPTVVVDSPVLVVHEQVETFESRLEASYDERGLTRRLTAQLYVLAWTRGYVQFGGLPIESVVGNRHVGLFTNHAALEYQRAAFGHSDPVGRATLRRETMETTLTDILSTTDSTAVSHLQDAREYAGLDQQPTDSLAKFESHPDAPSPHDQKTVGINETADIVFLSYLDEMNETIAETYTEEVRLDVSTTRVDARITDAAQSPEHDWNLRDTVVTNRTTVTTRTGRQPATVGHWAHHGYYPRTVELTRRTSKTWGTPDGTKRTTETEAITYAVDISLLGRHTSGPAPVGEVRTAYNPGGPLDGLNLADVPKKAERQLVDARGGPDDIAEQAVRGDIDTSIEQVQGEYPAALHRWVYTDTTDLRTEVANITTTNTHGAVASLDANPAAQLREKLGEQQSELVDAPESYDNVSHRAMIAARVAYLDSVDEWLAEREAEHETNKERLAEELPGEKNPLDRVQYGAQHQSETPPMAEDLHVPMRVETTPSYLTMDAISHEEVSAFPRGHEEHPLAVRTTNLVAAPYDNVASVIIDLVVGPERTRLRTAAQTLKAAENGNELAEPTTVSPGRPDAQQELQSEVQKGVDTASAAAVETLAEFDVGTRRSRRDAVRTALAAYERPHGQALALTNGTGTTAIYDEAINRWGKELTAYERDRLALELDGAVRQTSTKSSSRPPLKTVERVDDDTHDTLRKLSEDELSARLENKTHETLDELNATNRTLELANETATRLGNRTVRRLTNKTLTQLPKGVPVTPVPGYWYTTVNYWHVQVRGEYAQFTVRAPHGSADRPGADLVYVREDSPVRLDVTGDGQAERLGRTERIAFGTWTGIIVGVPPGPRGVGDVDGTLAETSPGWPHPGPR